MQEAQRYLAALLREPVSDTADLRLTVADELLLLGHAAEVSYAQPNVFNMLGEVRMNMLQCEYFTCC